MPSALPEQLMPADDDGFDPDRLLEVLEIPKIDLIAKHRARNVVR